MTVPHPIPYQGSKRGIAQVILTFFPHDIETLVEPFAGSAAVSLAAACHGRASRFHLNDINEALMELWRAIIDDPTGLADGYEELWNEQRGRRREFYFFIRDEFNKAQRPDYFLYLLARCVKASVRYNSRGKFNQSADNRRSGRRPENMRSDIYAASHLLRGRTIITHDDYGEVLGVASTRDLIYMDPPYQGVSNGGDPRYFSGIDFGEFVCQLHDLAKRGVSFILSYDGRKGDKTYGEELPTEVGLCHIEVQAGRSSQSTLLGRNEITYESLYLSPQLVSRLGLSPCDIPARVALSSRRPNLLSRKTKDGRGNPT